MSGRLSSDFFVSALLRQANGAGAFAALRHRGAPEAGAIFVLIDRLDGTATLFGPASQTAYGEADGERAFTRLHSAPVADRASLEAKLERERAFDPDCWIVEIEDRQGRDFLNRIV